MVRKYKKFLSGFMLVLPTRTMKKVMNTTSYSRQRLCPQKLQAAALLSPSSRRVLS
jgi:hypothetical protein